MTDNKNGSEGRTHARPTVSTRYDRKLIEWACSDLGISKAQLLKMALDEFIGSRMREAA